MKKIIAIMAIAASMFMSCKQTKKQEVVETLCKQYLVTSVDSTKETVWYHFVLNDATANEYFNATITRLTAQGIEKYESDTKDSGKIVDTYFFRSYTTQFVSYNGSHYATLEIKRQ